MIFMIYLLLTTNYIFPIMLYHDAYVPKSNQISAPQNFQ